MTDINRVRELAGKAETVARLTALADAYEPGMWALADGVCHVYYDVHECCQTLRDDLRLAVAALSRPEAEAALLDKLERAEKALTEERDGAFEADAWTQIVETYSLDTFDELASIWASREPIQRMNNALVSVFTKWANDDLMGRFKDQMDTIIRQAFVEGCIVGVRATEAKAALAALARDQETGT